MNRPRVHATILRRAAALFCLWLLHCHSLFAEQGNIMSNTISYTSTVADEFFATQLLITPDGVGKLSLTSNRDQRDRAIGQFQQLIPSNSLQNLSALLVSREFAEAPSQQTMLPGEAYREIVLTTPAQQQIDKLVGEELATPAVFGKAEQLIQEIIDYLQKFPALSLAMRLAPLPAKLEAGENLLIDITLRNQGRTPLFIESPQAWGQKATQGELKAVRADVPLAELGSQHQVFAQLDGSHFLQSVPEQSGPMWGLMPGEQIAMRFQQTVAWPAGRYQLEISLALGAFDQDGKPLFAGNLISLPQAVEVVEPQPK